MGFRASLGMIRARYAATHDGDAFGRRGLITPDSAFEPHQFAAATSEFLPRSSAVEEKVQDIAPHPVIGGLKTFVTVDPVGLAWDSGEKALGVYGDDAASPLEAESVLHFDLAHIATDGAVVPALGPVAANALGEMLNIAAVRDAGPHDIVAAMPGDVAGELFAAPSAAVEAAPSHGAFLDFAQCHESSGPDYVTLGLPPLEDVPHPVIG